MAYRLLVAISLLFVSVFSASAQECGKGTLIDGVWSAGKPVQVAMLCRVKYTCNMKESRMYDSKACKIVYTEAVTTTGACSAGRGPVDQCNSCLAPKPDKDCQWKMVKK